MDMSANEEIRLWYSVCAYYDGIAQKSGARAGTYEGIIVSHQEIIFLVSGHDYKEALAFAEAKAAQKEHSYTNEQNELIVWKLSKMETLLELIDDPCQSGAEVYWRFHSN